MHSTDTNYYTPTNEGQGFFLPPPPLRTRKKKPSEDCYSSFIDQIQGGDYSSAKLVRNSPRTNRDTHFIVRTFKAEVRSHRRNKTHRNVSLFKTKKDGSTRGNIEYMTCSFLELDGSTDSTVKTQSDIYTLISKNNLPTESYTIETSKGHFHLIWNYNRPLPWNERNESYWASQQKRLIQLFEQGGFLVDKGASLNPCQNLRNPSQLNPFNFKRGCRVEIHSSYQKTSLRAIYKALNRTSIPNPRPIPASVKLRRFSRANENFTMTHKELAETLGVSLRTEKREIKKAIANGDLRIVARTGNNSGQVRTTQYESMLFIEQFPEVPLSIFKDNSLGETNLLEKFKRAGTEKGRRNRTVFVLAVGLSCESNQTLTVSEIGDQLREGSLRSGLSEREFLRTVKNAVKPVYTNPLSLSKLQSWGLLKPEHVRKSFLQ